jgi:hypothetical protein
MVVANKSAPLARGGTYWLTVLIAISVRSSLMRSDEDNFSLLNSYFIEEGVISKNRTYNQDLWLYHLTSTSKVKDFPSLVYMVILVRDVASLSLPIIYQNATKPLPQICVDMAKVGFRANLRCKTI